MDSKINLAKHKHLHERDLSGNLLWEDEKLISSILSGDQTMTEQDLKSKVDEMVLQFTEKFGVMPKYITMGNDYRNLISRIIPRTYFSNRGITITSRKPYTTQIRVEGIYQDEVVGINSMWVEDPSVKQLEDLKEVFKKQRQDFKKKTSKAAKKVYDANSIVGFHRAEDNYAHAVCKELSNTTEPDSFIVKNVHLGFLQPEMALPNIDEILKNIFPGEKHIQEHIHIQTPSDFFEPRTSKDNIHGHKIIRAQNIVTTKDGLLYRNGVELGLLKLIRLQLIMDFHVLNVWSEAWKTISHKQF
jgi:hypothetical protein